MKKLALVLTFVFAAAMIAPAFAQDTQKKAADKAVVAKGTAKEGKGCSSECAKACAAKETKACCAKEAKPEAKK